MTSLTCSCLVDGSRSCKENNCPTREFAGSFQSVGHPPSRMDRWGNNDCTFSCYWSLQVIHLSTSFLFGRVFFSRVIDLQVYSIMASNFVLSFLCQKDRMVCLTVSFWDVGTYLMFGPVQADFFLPSTNEVTSRFGLMSLRSYVM